ncbi:flagellar FlbD family protein [Kineococcus rhizosphaerae]|uniref:Flagellar protein FlbD n=1 Tax=Kineococcus rhizosphaerae TaxID=559628 RepID=A0A2T0RAP7_9ACTN|nr:flagellar FlbD family protein [Kineococcus rhizosphaerae]PRY18210.1 flagellar protein FlbD [Kineococcus rhizosphaerae]
MILVTRLNGSVFAVNPDLIQRVDSTPDTVITLVDGAKFVVTEPLSEIVERVMAFRARVVATAHSLEETGTADVLELPTHPDAHSGARPTDHQTTSEADGTLPAPVPLHRRRP